MTVAGPSSACFGPDGMRVLGAVIAGGRSRRFGTDKALALFEKRTLAEHVVARLGAQVEALVTCGRDLGDSLRLEDRPRSGLGPLGGLNAALHHARARGFDGVLAVPVDVHPLPMDLRATLGGKTPAGFATQTMIGWWPADLADALDRHLAGGARSLRSFQEAVDMRKIDDSRYGLVNVNAPEDLVRLATYEALG